MFPSTLINTIIIIKSKPVVPAFIIDPKLLVSSSWACTPVSNELVSSKAQITTQFEVLVCLINRIQALE